MMAATPQVNLAQVSDLDGERFQMMWMQLPNSGQIQRAFRPGFFVNIQALEQKFTSQKLFTMASGQVGDETKFYLHSQLADKSGYSIAEVIFKQGIQQSLLTFKSTRSDLNPALKALYEKTMSEFTQ